MRADDDVELALREILLDLCEFLGGNEAGRLGHLDRQAAKAVAEGFVVLPGKQRGGNHDSDLRTVHGGKEGRAQRHFRLAEADVAANETVNWPAEIGRARLNSSH